jgi:hypothetical protein
MLDASPGGAAGLRETEVEHLDRAVCCERNVRRLQIAMHDPGLVGGVERVGKLARSAESFRDRQTRAFRSAEASRSRRI